MSLNPEKPPFTRSAGFQPAVSQISNLLAVEISDTPKAFITSADWQSAIQQIGNLRYGTRPL